MCARRIRADAAIFLTAFTGLRRGEVLALAWRNVDFAGSTIRASGSYAAGHPTTPKSREVRAVPMAPDVAHALARLGARDRFTGEDDFVFAGEGGPPLDGDALSSRYRDALKRAGLRPLRFHDLRHTFWYANDRQGDIRRVQEWMGHADIQTTMKYLHYAPRAEDAALVAQAFGSAASTVAPGHKGGDGRRGVALDQVAQTPVMEAGAGNMQRIASQLEEVLGQKLVTFAPRGLAFDDDRALRAQRSGRDGGRSGPGFRLLPQTFGRLG